MVKGFSKRLTLLPTLLFTALLTSFGCTSATVYPSPDGAKTARNALNINIADIDSMQELPGIGPQLAAKIVEHRTRYGPFRKPEHLLIVDGISEKRYREVEKLITTN